MDKRIRDRLGRYAVDTARLMAELDQSIGRLREARQQLAEGRLSEDARLQLVERESARHRRIGKILARLAEGDVNLRIL